MVTKYFTGVNCQVTAVVQRARRQEVSLTSCCQGTKIKSKQTKKHESPHTRYKAEQVAQEARLGMFWNRKGTERKAICDLYPGLCPLPTATSLLWTLKASKGSAFHKGSADTNWSPSTLQHSICQHHLISAFSKRKTPIKSQLWLA